MMRKAGIWALAFVLLLTVAGCGPSNEVPPEPTPAGNPEQEVEDPLRSEETDMESEETPEVPETEPQTEEEPEALTGLELVTSLDIQPPDTLYVEGTHETEGQVITTISYLTGENYRMETKVQNMEQVVIYSAAEGKIYTYTVGEDTGFVFSNEDNYNAENDVSQYAWDDTTNLADEIGDGLIKAERTTYDGQPVLYYETTFETETMDTVSRQWMSTEYWYPLKVETLIDGQIMSTYEVTEIDANRNFSDDLFTPPSNVNFMSFDDFVDPSMLEEMNPEDLEVPIS
jgi:outer membrane lipoprotein-sorting protein